MKFIKSEIAFMEKLYASDKYPSPEINHSVAAIFNNSRTDQQVTPKMLAGWFRSRRRKDAKTNKKASGLSAPIPHEQLASLQEQLHIGRVKAKELSKAARTEPDPIKSEPVNLTLPISQKYPSSTTSSNDPAKCRQSTPLPQVTDR